MWTHVLTQGFRGRRKNCYSLAVRAAHKKLQYAFVGRKLKKREMRKVHVIPWVLIVKHLTHIFGTLCTRIWDNTIYVHASMINLISAMDSENQLCCS